MSVKVNLLPQEQSARQAAARQRGVAAAAGLVLVAALGGAYWSQTQALTSAESEQSLAQSDLAAAQAEEAELVAFQDLRTQREAANSAVATALSSEISFAGLLQDVAAVTPTDTAFTGLDITRIDQVAADGDATRPVIARLVLEGESIVGHAPGLERVMLQFEKVNSFFDVFLTSATSDEDDPDVSIFTFEAELGLEGYTGRYLNGLPEELR